MNTNDRKSTPQTGASTTRMLAAGILLALFFWVVAAFIDAVIFTQGTFVGQLLTTDRGVILVRFLVILVFAVFAVYVQSVTNKRVKAESALQASERRYRVLVEQLPAATYVVDAGHPFTVHFVSPQIEEITGFNPEALKSGNDLWRGAIHPEDRDRVHGEIADRLDKRAPFTSEYRLVTRDNKTIWVMDQTKIVRGRDNRPVLLQGILWDITDRIATEERVREYEKAVEGSADLIVSYDRGYRYKVANRTFLQYHGLRRDQVIGRPVSAFLEKGTFEQVVKPNIDRCFKGATIFFEIPHDNPELGKRHLEIAYYPLSDGRGTVDRVVSVAKDITERKRVETALRESEDKFSKAFWSNPGAVAISTGKEGRFIDANESFLNMTGFSYEEVIGRTPEELGILVDGDEHRFLVDTIETDGCVRNHEYRFRRKNGQLGHGLVSAEKITIEGKTCVITVANDITDKVRLQAEAVRAGQLASLGELAAGVAHEINNPINGIIGYAEILKDQLAAKNAATTLPDRIIKEGDRIAAIVRNLLSFARERRDEKAPASVSAALKEALTLVEAQIRKAGIRLAVDMDAVLPKVRMRSQELQQVFLNLISNARHTLNQKYPDPHPDKRLSITGRAIDVDGRPHLRIRFTDTGMGIPAAIMDKIRNPFFSTKPAGEGTGLGLSISHGIVEDHGGRLWFDSHDGRGTTATIDLPAASEDTP